MLPTRELVEVLQAVECRSLSQNGAVVLAVVSHEARVAQPLGTLFVHYSFKNAVEGFPLLVQVPNGLNHELLGFLADQLLGLPHFVLEAKRKAEQIVILFLKYSQRAVLGENAPSLIALDNSTEFALNHLNLSLSFLRSEIFGLWSSDRLNFHTFIGCFV